MPVKKITCFTLGALAGALGMFAYREFQAAREIKALSDLTSESRYTVDPQADLGFLRRLSTVPLDADIETTMSDLAPDAWKMAQEGRELDDIIRSLQAEGERERSGKVTAFQALSSGVRPVSRGMTAPDLSDAVRLLLGDASLLGPNKSQEPS